jgi:serine/threonine-protein kinase
VPAKIGPYQILDVLHSGNRPLYKVKAADGRVLALKAVAVAGLSPEMRERFTREGDICRTLDHPNLVRVYDAGEADGNLYQTMDLLEGSDLSKVMAQERRFTWPEKLSIMAQVCEGLEYAHAHKLVHRDIKPANLFLEDSGRVRVLDFGMVRVADSNLTRVGSTLGTVNYMAPEQIRGTRCTAASDVFSAGIVFFQLASGRHPFSSRERSLAQVVKAIVFEPPPKLSEICPDAPEGLEFLLNKALDKEPERRPQDGGALKQAVGLCRITLDFADSDAAAPPVRTPGPAPENVQTSAPPLAARPVPREEAKTQVRKINPADLVKPRPPQPPPPVPPKPQVMKPEPPAPQRYRYCPSCTSANPLFAVVCTVCNSPLVISRGDGTGEKRWPWSLYIAIAIAVLLATALVVVLIVKS